MDVKIIIADIQWDTDDELLDLPNEVSVEMSDKDFEEVCESGLADYLGDYLSDTYGFCHTGFTYRIDYWFDDIEFVGDKLVVSLQRESDKKTIKYALDFQKMGISEEMEFEDELWKDFKRAIKLHGYNVEKVVAEVEKSIYKS